VGHQKILAVARELAGSDRPVVAMTFEPPPDLVLRPTDSPQRLSPPPHKQRLILEAGADWVVTITSDAALLGLTADEFIAQVLQDRLGPRHLVEGDNFFFGRGRAGDVEVLRQAGQRLGFEVHVVEPVTMSLGGRAERVSSTLIRRLLADGEVADAARCLSRPYTIVGAVVRGAGVGRTLDFPTANLDPGPQVVPAAGVYAGRARVAGGTSPAAVSIGTKPTFGGAPRTIEAFLLDATGDFYGQELSLEFLTRLRGQRRFDGVGALRAQIAKDVLRVRELCR
jgi:riboflavin kinase/FMN adenylyltransferase